MIQPPLYSVLLSLLMIFNLSCFQVKHGSVPFSFHFEKYFPMSLSKKSVVTFNDFSKNYFFMIIQLFLHSKLALQHDISLQLLDLYTRGTNVSSIFSALEFLHSMPIPLVSFLLHLVYSSLPQIVLMLSEKLVITF